MDIWISSGFEAAHSLPRVEPGHRCGRLHGHSFRMKLSFRGDQDPEKGWVQDFADLKKVVKHEVTDRLDHNHLNEIPGLDNPTSENIARWVWGKVKTLLPSLISVEVSETCSTGAVYRGDA